MTDVLASVREAVAEAAKEVGVDLNKPGEAATGTSATTETERPRGSDGKFTAQPGGENTEVPQEEGEGQGQGDGTQQTEETNTEGGEGESGEKPPPAAAAATEEEEDSWKPSAEELEVIDKNPELKKVYRSMVRGLTQKTTDLANKRKEAEMALEVVQAVRKNPELAIRAMAAAAGLKIAEPAAAAAAPETPEEKSIQDRVREKLQAKLGKEAADVLAPALLEVVQEINGVELAPIKERFAASEKQAGSQALRAGIAEFGAKVVESGGEWNEEIEKEMAALVPKIQPAEGTTLPEFLEILHANVMTKRTRKGTVQRQTTRIKEAAKAVEPRQAARPAPTAEKSITPGMDPKEATAFAVAQAKADLGVR